MPEQYATILETKRLLLRRLIPGDLDSLLELYSDPEVTRYIPDAPKTYEEAREELEWFQNGHPKYPSLGLWATIDKETGKFIGRCGLLPWIIDGLLETEVAYTISRPFWGQGFATEAAQAIKQYGLEKLNLPHLVCLVDPDNVASQKVAVKIGMSLERKVDGINGDNIPTLIYSTS